MHFIQSLLQEDFKRITDDTMKKVIKYLNNSESFARIFEFNVNGTDHYFISLFRDGDIEIHFGYYKKKAFGNFWVALEKQEVETVRKILQEENLFQKDDLSRYSTHDLELLLSNVMAMLIKVVEKNDPAGIKIMGQPDGCHLYREFILNHIHLLPWYYLKRDTFDDWYKEKNGETIPAKALLLKSTLADQGKYDLIQNIFNDA